MALSMPPDSHRRWRWGPLHSWSIFSSSRAHRRPRAPPPPPAVPRNRPSRPFRGRHHNEASVNPGSPSSTYTGMAHAASPRRRRVTARRGEAIEATSWNGRRSRPGSNTTHHQHHDDHRHYDRNRHHYHVPPRIQVNPDLGTALTVDQGYGGSSTISENEQTSRSVRSRNMGMYRSAFLSRFSFMNEQREAAREARERLDDRLRAAALLSNRRNLSDSPTIFPDDFDLIFEEEDIWSDDEIWEMGMRDWLGAWDMEERWPAEISPEMVSKPVGMSKAQLNNLAKEVFVPFASVKGQGFKGNKTMASEQEVCPVCLEQFMSGQTLFCLPCKHRFHLDCLSPWLESHTQCPYCRAEIGCEDFVQDGSSSIGSSELLHEDEDFLSWMTIVDSSFSRLNFYSWNS